MMPENLVRANETRRKNLLARVDKALQEPTMVQAREVYGGNKQALLRAVTVAGRREEYDLKYAEERRAAIRSGLRVGGAGAASVEAARRRRDERLEDLEFMARTGETKERAAERMGYDCWDNLRSTLLVRNGRLDLEERFERNEIRPYVKRGRVAA